MAEIKRGDECKMMRGMSCENRLHNEGKLFCGKSVIYGYGGSLAAMCLAVALTFSGCGAGTRANAAGEYETLAEGSSETGTVTLLDAEGMFSDRDQDMSYDKERAVLITLQGNTATAESANVQVQDGTVRITGEGCYILSGEWDGTVMVEADKKEKIQLVLQGATVSSVSSAALYVKQADKVFVTTAEGTENVLETTGEYQAVDDNNIDGAVYAKDDITFNGAGRLVIRSAAGHGIVCKDDLVIAGGRYEITAQKHGLQGKDSVRIAGGSIIIDAQKDGIHSGNDEDESKGYTYIAGGEITVKAADDGIHADTQLIIAGGNINVTESYEGLEGKCVEIAGGYIQIKSRDDGVNAAGGNDGSGKWGKFGGGSFADDPNIKIIISGGELTIDAEGDGVDSNGSLSVSGGKIIVYGPVNGGNGALDFNGEAVITGGEVIALGDSQMAENFGANSKQCSILVNVQTKQAAGSAAELKDAAGNVILGCKSEKRFNSAVFSSPQIKVGETYTVVLGETDTEVEMKETIYGSGMGMGGFGGGMRPGGRPQGDMPQPPEGGFPEGEMPNWELPEGGFPEGEMPNWELPEGGFPEGEQPNWNQQEGEKPKKDFPKNNRPEGGKSRQGSVL